MYKELVISIIIVIFIIVVENITGNYLEESIDSMELGMTDIRNLLLEKKDVKEIKDKYDSILSEWKERYEKLAYYVEHDELEKVETNLVKLKSNIDTQNFDEGIEKIDEGSFLLEHIRNKDTLNLKNIF